MVTFPFSKGSLHHGKRQLGGPGGVVEDGLIGNDGLVLVRLHGDGGAVQVAVEVREIATLDDEA